MVNRQVAIMLGGLSFPGHLKSRNLILPCVIPVLDKGIWKSRGDKNRKQQIEYKMLLQPLLYPLFKQEERT